MPGALRQGPRGAARRRQRLQRRDHKGKGLRRERQDRGRVRYVATELSFFSNSVDAMDSRQQQVDREVKELHRMFAPGWPCHPPWGLVGRLRRLQEGVRSRRKKEAAAQAAQQLLQMPRRAQAATTCCPPSSTMPPEMRTPRSPELASPEVAADWAGAQASLLQQECE